MDEIIVGCRKLHNKELHNSLYIIKKINLKTIGPGHVARWGGGEDPIQGFVGKSRRKEQLGRSRSKWDHIKMNITEIVWWRLWTGFIRPRTETSAGPL
jgi:hypothetical protein